MGDAPRTCAGAPDCRSDRWGWSGRAQGSRTTPRGPFFAHDPKRFPQLDEEPAGRAGGGPGEGRNPQSTPGALHLDKILSVVGPMRGTCRKIAPLEIRGCFLPGEFSSGSSHTKFRGGFGGNLEVRGRGAAWWRVLWFRGALTRLAGVKGPDGRRGSGRSGRRAAVMSRGRSDRLRMKPRSGQKARVGK